MDKIPTYKISIDPEEEGQEERLGMYAIAFTDSPAIITKGIAFSEQKKMLFTDKEKMRIAAPVMIPNVEIFRHDEETGEEYNVVFEEDVIEKIHSKFMENMKNSDLFNLEHDEEEKVPAYILEMWMVQEPTKDKSFSTYGIQVPKGTLFAVAQVTDEAYFEQLVKNDQLGFSIEAILNIKLSKFIKQDTMNLPDGKFTAEDGKVYEVKNGVPVLLTEEEEEKEQEMNQDSEEVEETVEAAEEEKEEEAEETEEKAEEESEEEMSVDPEADAEAIMSVVQPMFDAFKNEVLEILADRLPAEEEAPAEEGAEESEEEMTEVQAAMSAHEKLEKVRNYSSKK
jgi:uncharacterized protein YbaR (Trm112 family)